MSKQEKREFETFEQTLPSGLRRVILIEYKVIKEEIGRYYIELKEGDKIT